LHIECRCGGKPARQFRVTEDAQHGGGHGLRAASRHHESCVAFAQDERDAADVGADDRNTARHRFQNGIGHVVDAAGIDHDRGRAIERGHLVAVARAAEMHALPNAKLAAKRFQRLAFRARSRYGQPDVGHGLADQREGPQRGGNVVNGFQIACDDQMACCGTLLVLCGTKSLEIDDVGNDLGAQSVTVENFLQEPRRHDQGRWALQGAANHSTRARKESPGLAATVVDYGRDVAPACDPYCRRGAQMP
jgi:hypothetical protein